MRNEPNSRICWYDPTGLSALVGNQLEPCRGTGAKGRRNTNETVGGTTLFAAAAGMKRLALVADNALILDAVRKGLRDRGMFELIGYVDARRASADAIVGARPDVVLVDDMDQSETAISLIRELHDLDATITILVLMVRMQGDWLERALAAGAEGAISKLVHPIALGTLVREALNKNIAHSPASIAAIRAEDNVTMIAHSSLTPREFEILRLVAAGATNGDIARELWVTEQTVKFHVSNIYRKLGVANRTEACHYAHVNRLLGPTPPLTAAS
jgi:DNA-binding NarL/FixJ family response regulator